MSFQVQLEAPAPGVAAALLIPTSMLALMEQGWWHSVRGGRSLFGGGGIWTCPLTLAGDNWWCDHQLELALSLPSGRVKIWIPCYASSRGTLAMLCIAASVSVWGMDGLLSTCPSFLSFHFSELVDTYWLDCTCT